MIRAALIGIALLCAGPLGAAPTAVNWQDWSPAAFAQARTENRTVFLYLEAVWCHWCHVMRRDTFGDAAVQAALGKHFVAVRVDHDAHPALANRYRDYGWPALIFLAADGTEIVKRAGYIAPQPFARLLHAIAADPSPERSPPPISAEAGPSALSDALREELLAREPLTHDRELGGLATQQKFLDRNSVEYALARAAVGSPPHAQWAQQTLDAARALMDPAWGGMYQYSTHARWDHPHYEKLMRTQAGALRLYAQAYALWRRPQDLVAARDIVRYLKSFLRGSAGAFQVSQDADLVPGEKAHGYFVLGDAARRKLGVPRVDQNLYGDVNGMAIEALAQFARLTGEREAAELAVAAAAWALRERALPGGGFRHGERDRGGPYLADTLWLGRGFLALHQLSAERAWLEQAARAAEFMLQRFRTPAAGFATAVAGPEPLPPRPDRDENVAALRLLALLSHYTGRAEFRAGAEHAMRFLASEGVARAPFEQAGILLADQALRENPVQLTVVGAKSDSAARALYEAAGQIPESQLRLEWWDRSDGPLPNADVQYPEFAQPAGYVCTERRCSAPSFTVENYRRQIARLTSK